MGRAGASFCAAVSTIHDKSHDHNVLQALRAATADRRLRIADWGTLQMRNVECGRWKMFCGMEAREGKGRRQKVFCRMVALRRSGRRGAPLGRCGTTYAKLAATAAERAAAGSRWHRQASPPADSGGFQPRVGVRLPRHARILGQDAPETGRLEACPAKYPGPNGQTLAGLRSRLALSSNQCRNARTSPNCASRPASGVKPTDQPPALRAASVILDKIYRLGF